MPMDRLARAMQDKEAELEALDKIEKAIEEMKKTVRDTEKAK